MFCLQYQWIEGDWNDACVATMVWQSMIVSYAKYRHCYEGFLRHMEHCVYVKYGRESLQGWTMDIQMVFGNEYLLRLTKLQILIQTALTSGHWLLIGNIGLVI